MAASHRSDGNRKVREHRDRLRQMGLRPVQMWVQDVRTASFRRRARQQARAVRDSAYAEEDQRFIDSISEFDN